MRTKLVLTEIGAILLTAIAIYCFFPIVLEIAPQALAAVEQMKYEITVLWQHWYFKTFFIAIGLLLLIQCALFIVKRTPLNIGDDLVDQQD